MHKVNAIEEAQTLGQTNAKIIVSLYLLLHKSLIILRSLIVMLKIRAGHYKLLDVLFMYLYAVHPHAPFLGKRLLDMNETPLSFLNQMVDHLCYLYL